jgi:hypothetical protein
MSWTLTAVGIGVSVLWFTRVIRNRQEHAAVPVEITPRDTRLAEVRV